jgi:membrane protease YdiL (CAAX protease family)
MARHVVLLGGSAPLLAALRVLCHPDDRVTRLHELREWPALLDTGIQVDAVVLDLPIHERLSAVERIRVTYRGHLVVMIDWTDDRTAFPVEHRCLIVKRPIDIGQLAALVTTEPSGRTAPVHQPATAAHPGRGAAGRPPGAVQPGHEAAWTVLARHPSEGGGRAPAAASGSAATATSAGPLAPAPPSAPAARARSRVSGWASPAGTSLLLTYLAAVAASELLWQPLGISVLATAACNGLLALLLCLGLRATTDARTAALLPPLVAISVVRLITLAALPANVHPLQRLVVVGGPALVAAGASARLRSPEWRLLRPRRGGWSGQALVTLGGIPLALLVWLLAPPTVQLPAGASTVVAGTVLVLFAALPDELLYRGLLVPASVGVAGGWGLPLASLAYALAYLPGGSAWTVLLAFLVSMVLGWCRQRTGSVVGVVAAHGLLNVLVYLMLPLSGF